MTTTSTNTITVTLADLDVALGATLPFTAAADADLPGDFDVLHLSAADDQITVAASNGYVAAQVRKPATGCSGSTFQLDRTHAQQLRSALAFYLDRASTMPITLTITDQWPDRLLTVSVDGDFSFRFQDRIGHPASLDRLFATPAPDTPDGGDTPLAADRIAPFLQAAALAKGEPLHWRLYGPGRHGHARLGDWFTGLLMPAPAPATAVTGR